MRLTPVILGASLLANAGLVALLFLRAPAPVAAPSAAMPHPTADSAQAARDLAKLRTALASGDAAALSAAGCPPDVVRIIAFGRALDRLTSRVRDIRAQAAAAGPYWQRSRSVEMSEMGRMRPALQQAQREFGEALLAQGLDPNAIFGGNAKSYDYLPAATAQRLRRIEQDYNDMMAQVYSDNQGVQLPSDREKIKMLIEARKSDIAAALIPEQREQYELHDSQTARNVSWQYGAALNTEDDYRRIFALEKAFDDRFSSADGGPLSPDVIRQRDAAAQELRQQIDAQFTPEQRAALQRANDSDIPTLNALERRLSLPDSVTDNVLQLRSTYAMQSQQINADATLSPADRRAQLQALATRAQADLGATLGTEGAQVYVARAEWMGLLRGGTAFTTDPSQSTQPGFYAGVYRVKPPVAPAPAPNPGS